MATHRSKRPTVLLVHGLWMHAPSMYWLAHRLQAEGFRTYCVGYYSLLQSTEQAIATLSAAARRQEADYVIAHSLGGLLSLQAIAQGMHIRRLVCLGSPLQGSRAARVLCASGRLAQQLVGAHRALLCQGLPADFQLPAAVQVGQIAGTRGVGLGHWFARHRHAHDGTVAVAETHHPCLHAHICVDVSHSGGLFSPQVLAQSVAFLCQGKFLPAPTPC